MPIEKNGQPHDEDNYIRAKAAGGDDSFDLNQEQEEFRLSSDKVFELGDSDVSSCNVVVPSEVSDSDGDLFVSALSNFDPFDMQMTRHIEICSRIDAAAVNLEQLLRDCLRHAKTVAGCGAVVSVLAVLVTAFTGDRLWLYMGFVAIICCMMALFAFSTFVALKLFVDFVKDAASCLALASLAKDES